MPLIGGSRADQTDDHAMVRRRLHGHPSGGRLKPRSEAQNDADETSTIAGWGAPSRVMGASVDGVQLSPFVT